MSDRRATEAEIERSLRDLGANLAYPPTPDLASAVRVRLTAAPSHDAAVEPSAGRPTGSAHPAEPSAHPARGVPWRLWPRPALAAAAALVASVLVLAAWPDARTAVADALGLRGVVISRLPSAPTPPAAATSPNGRGAPGAAVTPPGARLGEPTTLEDVARRVPFRVLRPEALGQPDELYLDPSTAGGQVIFVYRPRPGLPATASPEVGGLFGQFQAGLEPGFFAKGLGPDTRLEMLTVNGGRAVWLEGRPHLFYYRGRDGEIRDESIRLAGNVLLWEQEGLTLRLEANVPKDEAVRIASSVR